MRWDAEATFERPWFTILVLLAACGGPGAAAGPAAGSCGARLVGDWQGAGTVGIPLDPAIAALARASAATAHVRLDGRTILLTSPIASMSASYVVEERTGSACRIIHTQSDGTTRYLDAEILDDNHMRTHDPQNPPAVWSLFERLR